MSRPWDKIETRRLIEQVKRNGERFPEDFMFQLSRDEADALRSQSATSNQGRGGRRYAVRLNRAGRRHALGRFAKQTRDHRHIEIMRAFRRVA